MGNFLQIIHLFSSELDLNGADILPNGPEVLPDSFPARIDLLWINTILGMQILNFPIGKNPVKLVLNLVLGSQPRPQSQTLLFPRQFQQIRALSHDGGAACRHFENLLLGGFPRYDIEFLHLGLPEQPAGAAGEDRGRGAGVELRRGEAGRSLCGGGLSLGGDLDEAGR